MGWKRFHFASAAEALTEAKAMNHRLVLELQEQQTITKEMGIPNLSATTHEAYYAYDANGNFLGGDEELVAALKVDYKSDPLFAHLYKKDDK